MKREPHVAVVAIVMAALAGWGSPTAVATETADLAVALTTRADPIAAGSVAIWEIIVINHGPARASGVELQHELPPGSVLVGVEPGSVTCEGFTELLIDCDLGALEAGATVELSVAAWIDPRVDGTVRSEVVVGASQADPNADDDEAELETAILAARQMISTSRAGRPALALTLREGVSTVGLAVVDPSEWTERAYKVEAVGHRSAALVEVPHYAGTESPEIASLAAGFDGGTRVVIVDAESRELLGDHAVPGEWLPREIVTVESFAGSTAPDLGLLLWDRTQSACRLEVIDAATGAPLRSHALGSGVPIAAATVGSELAVLTRGGTGGATRLLIVDPDTGPARDHELGFGLLPLALAALADLGVEGGTSAPELAILVRTAEGALRVLLIDSGDGAQVGTIDFDGWTPGPLIAGPPGDDGAARLLALAGRRSERLEVALRDAATGGEVGELSFDSIPPGSVPLALAWLRGFEGRASSRLAIVLDPSAGPSRIGLFDPASIAPVTLLSLP